MVVLTNLVKRSAAAAPSAPHRDRAAARERCGYYSVWFSVCLIFCSFFGDCGQKDITNLFLCLSLGSSTSYMCLSLFIHTHEHVLYALHGLTLTFCKCLLCLCVRVCVQVGLPSTDHLSALRKMSPHSKSEHSLTHA